jgi:hypothetical protein
MVITFFVIHLINPQDPDYNMKEYIGLEIGSSAYTEFKMESGEFEQTEDCIMVGRVWAENKEGAEKKIRELEFNVGREFDELVLIECC